MSEPSQTPGAVTDLFGEAIGRPSVAQEVVERIKRSLIRGDLRPGDFLPSENALTRSLGVGKSSVREAIKMLQGIGVVETRRGQGVVIRDKPGNSLVDPLAFGMILAGGVTRDVLEFRRMFEPAYTLQAMAKATEADDHRIGSTIEAMERAIAEGDQTAQHDAAFHRSILQASRNAMTIRVGETLIELVEAALATSMKTLPERALRDHKAIFTAFRNRDGAGVVEAIEISSQSWETVMSYEDDGSELIPPAGPL